MKQLFFNISKKNSMILFFILFLSTSLLANSDNLIFEKLSIEEGLSQSIVIDIYEDNNGFLWIGTQDGLNKYDGYKFTHFRTDVSASNNISDNYITSIIEDDSLNLWIGTNGGGLNKFNPLTEKFKIFDKNIAQNSLANTCITDLEIDTSGNIWIGTIKAGITIYNPKLNRFTSINKSSLPLLPSNKINFLKHNIDGNFIWVGTSEGLVIYDIDTKRIIDLNYLLFKDNETNKKVLSFLFDNNSNIWIGTDNQGLFKLENFVLLSSLPKIEVKNYQHNPNDQNSISGNSINAIYETKNGNIWIGVWGGGVCKIESNEYNNNIYFTSYKHSTTNPKSLSENDIITITEDNSGVIWIGTYGGGLNKINPHSINFKHYTHNPTINNSLSQNRVFSIYQQNNETLWIGTWGGLNRYDFTTNNFKHYLINDKKKKSISDNRITSIIEDKNNYLWIGTLDKGINRYNIKTNQFTHFLANPDSENTLISNRVISLLNSSDGKIWIGTLDKGISIYNPKTKKFTQPEIKNGIKDISKLKRIKCLFEDHKENIYWGTYAGLYKYYSKSKRLDFININGTILSNTCRITAINESRNGDIWVGTFGKGLIKLTPNGNSYITKEFHLIDRLPNEFIYSIQIDNNENIWISTNKGIARIHHETNEILSYTDYEGLHITEFKDGAYYHSPTDKMYMGGVNGFVEFTPSNLSINYKEPNIVFTELKIYNKKNSAKKDEALYKSISELNELNIEHDENSFSVKFAALNFISPKSISYSYKLEGLDNEETFVDHSHRIASYTSLKPGKYTLKIKAYLNRLNNTGFVKELNINIIPPFWNTIWFKIIGSIVILLLLFLGVKWQTYNIEQGNLKLKKEVQERTKELEEINQTKDRFFSIIAHDLKGPFSYLLNNSEFLSNDIKSLSRQDINELAANINISANNVYNLLENLLQWSKLQMMGIEPNYQNFVIEELISKNIGLLKQLAEKKSISITKQVTPNLTVNSDMDILDIVIRNLLANSIKYTKENGSITISASRAKETFEINVSDTGIGMSKKQIDKVFAQTGVESIEGTENEKGTGMGLVLCINFINVIGGAISIESKKNIGTQVKCIVPNRALKS